MMRSNREMEGITGGVLRHPFTADILVDDLQHFVRNGESLERCHHGNCVGLAGKFATLKFKQDSGRRNDFLRLDRLIIPLTSPFSSSDMNRLTTDFVVEARNRRFNVNATHVYRFRVGERYRSPGDDEWLSVAEIPEFATPAHRFFWLLGRTNSRSDRSSSCCNWATKLSSVPPASASNFSRVSRNSSRMGLFVIVQLSKKLGGSAN